MGDASEVLLSLQLPSRDTSPADARDAMEALAPVLDGAYHDMLVAVSELVTNAVRHAEVGPDARIELQVRRFDDRIRVEVTDEGTGFTKPREVRPLEEGQDHGCGLAMVDEFADRWGVDGGDGTTVWLEVDVSPAAEAVRAGLARSLLDAAIGALISLDPAGTVMDWNQGAADCFGYERHQAVGRRVTDLIAPPPDPAGAEHYLRATPADATARIDGRAVEMPLMRRDGSHFPAMVRMTASDVDGRRYYHLAIQDVSAQKRSEEASAEMLAYVAYLADASEVLASSLDVDRTLRKLARLVVPTHADWCTINLLEEDGSIRRVAAEHADPARAAELARLLDTHPNEPDADSGVGYVIRTGEAQLFAEVTDALLAETANDPEYLEITAQLMIRSCVIAPLEARGRVLGSISLVYTEQEKTYGEADLALAQDLGRRAGLAIDNARLYEQRDNIAITLQRSLLPPYLPDIPEFEVAARYEPAGTGNEVGGDFYDVFEAAGGGWNLVVGDVEGKGPRAAALIGLARHTLRAVAFDHPSPADALTMLNRVLLSNATELCCTVVLCRLEVAESPGRVVVALAGHPAPLMLRRGGYVEPIGQEGMLLGAIAEPPIHEVAADVYPGDNLVLFSDGVLGRHASDGDMLADLLTELAGKPASVVADEIAVSAERAQPGGLGDDVAILVARDARLRQWR